MSSAPRTKPYSAWTAGRTSPGSRSGRREERRIAAQLQRRAAAVRAAHVRMRGPRARMAQRTYPGGIADDDRRHERRRPARPPTHGPPSCGCPLALTGASYAQAATGSRRLDPLSRRIFLCVTSTVATVRASLNTLQGLILEPVSPVPPVVGRGWERAESKLDGRLELAKAKPSRYSMPRRSSRRSSPRQSRRTRTDRSRWTRVPELALELAARRGADRLDHPPAGADEDALLGLGLDPDERADDGEVVARLRRSPRRSTSTACGTSWNVRRRICSRMSSASMHARRLVAESSSASKRNGPSGRSATRCSTSASTPAPLRAEIGKIVVADLELGRGLQRRPACAARSSRSTLLTAITTGTPAVAQRGGDEAVAGPDALLAVEDAAARRRRRRARARRGAACAAVSASRGRCTPGRSTSTSCASPRVATPRIARRVVCGLSETIATLLPDDRVDERRLADVRPPGERDEARPRASSTASPRQHLALEGEHLAVVGLVVHAGQVQRAVDDRLAQVAVCSGR